ncbi:hypothetical protein G6L28_17720 [Agrobacterium larrymoorei]|uniref:hypothetical protein n=1 Tax=Agrobacterium larrymoorei TaxID=160699 RepID=UPI001573C0F7|nr:hypothetical protein [Agrobacterium larrymoorei]NTJ44437.1 hypothetical protein [Agrobacterium larrymoorei]
MNRFAWSAAACLLLTGTTIAMAQNFEVSSLESKRPAELGASLKKAESHTSQAQYIIDVSGRRVRMVGPRFYPESNKDIELIGRADALQREAVRLEASLPPDNN